MLARQTDVPDTIAFAAEQLDSYWRQICGEGSHAQIALRADPAACPAVEDPALDDAYTVEVTQGEGFIAGSNPRSVLLGVYAFLTAVGCRFIRPGPDGEILPRLTVEEMTAHLARRADYRYRGFSIEGAVSRENVYAMIDWAPKLGYNLYFIQFREAHVFFEEWYTHVYNEFLPADKAYSPADSRAIVEELGPEIRRRGMQYHAMGHGWICESIGYHSTGWHAADNSAIPDDVRPLLAEVGGKREFFGGIPVNTNLCYSNPEVQRRLVEEIVGYAAEHPEKEVLHIWLADNFNNTCECENCRELRPADFYVRMLNEVDRRLTARGLSTRIGFILGYDLLWTPLKERIENPGRFLLLFAPITRTYREPYLRDGETIDRAHETNDIPYVRNHLILPENAHQNLRFLFDWQRQFGGDCVIFEYHMMWDIHKDYAQMNLARVQFRDVELLRDMGLNGYISCQLTRSFFPSGLCNTLLGRKLFDRSLPYEEAERCYFEDAYGEEWEDARALLWDISDGFSWSYSRGELPVVHPETAALLKETPAKLYAWQDRLRARIAREAVPARRKMWEFLLEATEVYAELALVLYNKASGLPTAQVKAQFELFRQNLCRRETRLQEVFDLCSFVLIVNTIIKKEDEAAIGFDEKAI